MGRVIENASHFPSFSVLELKHDLPRLRITEALADFQLDVRRVGAEPLQLGLLFLQPGLGFRELLVNERLRLGELLVFLPRLPEIQAGADRHARDEQEAEHGKKTAGIHGRRAGGEQGARFGFGKDFARGF